MENMGNNVSGPTEEVKNLLLQGFRAAKEGRREEAYQLFCEVVARDPDNEYGWLYRAATTDSRSEAYVCLQKVLSINPNNTKAQRGLERIREQQQEDNEEVNESLSVDTPTGGYPGAAPATNRPFTSMSDNARPSSYPGIENEAVAPVPPPIPSSNYPSYNGPSNAAIPDYELNQPGPNNYQAAPPPDYDPAPAYQASADQLDSLRDNGEEQLRGRNKNRREKNNKRGKDRAGTAAFGAEAATDLDPNGRRQQQRTRGGLLTILLFVLVIAAILAVFLLLIRNNGGTTDTNQTQVADVATATAAAVGTGAVIGPVTTGSAQTTSGVATTSGASATTAAAVATGAGAATTAANANATTGAATTTTAANTTAPAATTAAATNTTVAASTTAAAQTTTAANPTPVVAANPSPTSGQTKPVLYRVVPGDNLTRITALYKTSADAVRAANRYYNPVVGDRITANTSLIIPVERPDFRGSGTVVQPNDTLDSIAAKYKTTVDDIVKLNGLSGPTDIKPGDALLIPTII